jgi:hypothetical protein
MSSTTSKRLRRVWGIVDSAAETGAVVVSIAYLEAALVGGEKWAKLEGLAAQAPLPPDEYRAAYADAMASSPPDRFGPFEPGPDYEFWYESELDRLAAEQDKILNAPDVVL